MEGPEKADARGKPGIESINATGQVDEALEVEPSTLGHHPYTDVITLIRDPEQPLGKRADLAPDGSIVKRSAVHAALLIAVQRRIPDAEAMQALLTEVANDPHLAISNVAYPGVPIGDAFLIVSEKEAKRRGLGKARDELVGVHDVSIRIGTKVYAKAVVRFKENVAPSTWQYLDRDVDEHTPPEIAAWSDDQWLAHVDRILPGIASCMLVHTRSTGSRVARIGAEAKLTNGHTWFQVQDPRDVERLRAAVVVRAAQLGLTWRKPRCSRRDPRKVIGHSLGTIIDASVFTPGRLVFNGMPVVGPGLEVLPQEVTVVNGDAGSLDTRTAELPPARDIPAITRQAGSELHLRHGGSSLTVDAYDLTFETELEIEGGEVMSVREAAVRIPEGGKLRCQTPFRESTSFAGVLRHGRDGRLCLFDVGTSTSHWLCDQDYSQVVAEQFDDLTNVDRRAVDDVLTRIDVHELIGESPAALINDVKRRLADVQIAEDEAARIIDRARAAGVTGIEPVLRIEKPLRFEVLPLSTFINRRSLGWIVKGVLPWAELVVVFGESGAGKSFLVVDMAAAVARGLSWRGRRVIQGAVVYVAAEGAGGARNRFRAYCHEHQLKLEDVPIGVIENAPNLMLAEDVKDLIAAIRRFGSPLLIVVDTLAQSMPGGNENTGEDVGRVLGHCKQIHKSTGAMVVLVHHAGKDTTKGARGWSGLRAAADAEIEIVRDGSAREAIITKLKDGQDGLRFPFRLLPTVIGEDEDGDEITSCIVEHVDAHPAKVWQPQGAVQQAIYQAVIDACGLGGGVAEAEIVSAVVATMDRPAAGKRDNRKGTVARALDSLIDGGRLIRNEGLIRLPGVS